MDFHGNIMVHNVIAVHLPLGSRQLQHSYMTMPLNQNSVIFFFLSNCMNKKKDTLSDSTE